MGCWNKTCGLSNLHIRANEDVYVFVLQKNPNTDRCYSTAFYKPLLLPFYSKYNDYGGGEDSHGVGLDYIMQGLREALVEVDVGENTSHDIAVTRDGFDEEAFFDSVHENRLQIDGYHGPVEVDFVMFRKDIVDDILDNWVQEKYVGEGQGTSGYGNSYLPYTFSDVLAGLPAALDRIEAMLSDELELTSVVKTLPRSAQIKFLGLGALFDWNHPNKVGWYIHRDNYRYSQIVRVHEIIIEAMERGDRLAAEALMTDYLKAVYIDTFMDSVRKVWMPGGHEGSQAQDHDGYRALINAMTKALDKELAEDADEDEDYFVEDDE